MKKPLLLSASLLSLGLITAIYAQTTTTGGSIVDKMKAAAHSFSLSSVLNPTDTGLTSDPIKGKKTGDMLTAGEWNRVLELVSEGGSGGGSSWVDVPLTGTENFDEQCMYRFKTQTSGRQPYVGGDPYYYPNGITSISLTWWFENDAGASTWHIYSSSKTVLRLNGAVYSAAGNITKIQKLCGGGVGGGSGWENVPLTDTADYDTACLYEVNVKTTAALHNNLMNGDTSWRTGTARTNKYLGLAFTDGSATTYASWGVPSSSKSTYGYRDSAGTFVPSSGVSILGMRKLCGGGGGGLPLYKCTNAQSLDPANAPCYGASRNGGAGTNQYRVVSCSNTDASGTYTAGGLLNFGDFIANKWSFHINNSNIACADGSVLVMDIRGGNGGSAGSPSNLVYINPDNTNFTPLECTPGMNYMIHPIAFTAASASIYTDKKLAILKSGNWRVIGADFSRNRSINSGTSHTLRFNSVIDGVVNKLFENTVDLGLYASSFSEDIVVPTGKTAEINISIRNNIIYGGSVTVWCTN